MMYGYEVFEPFCEYPPLIPLSVSQQITLLTFVCMEKHRAICCMSPQEALFLIVSVCCTVYWRAEEPKVQMLPTM